MVNLRCPCCRTFLVRRRRTNPFSSLPCRFSPPHRSPFRVVSLPKCALFCAIPLIDCALCFADVHDDLFQLCCCCCDDRHLVGDRLCCYDGRLFDAMMMMTFLCVSCLGCGFSISRGAMIFVPFLSHVCCALYLLSAIYPYFEQLFR